MFVPPTSHPGPHGGMLDRRKSDIKPIRDRLDSDENFTCDLPPAYDALSPRGSTNDVVIGSEGWAADVSAGPSADLPISDLTALEPPVSIPERPLPPTPPRAGITSSPRNAGSELTQKPQTRKTTSWLSHLPFASSFTARRVRRSVLSIVNNLVAPPRANEEQKNAHDILASAAETCMEHKLSLSNILQEPFIADHTPMYWATINYRPELLVALLVYSRPLSSQSISEIRCACLVSSNQALFHALRVCRPPFNRTDGIQVPSTRTASTNLLLGNRPLDEIYIQLTSDQAFVVCFDISLWQRRMKVIGQVGVEFIASGRMWSIIFFSTDPSSPVTTSGKSKKGKNTWHVMISLLESSPPTYFDSQLVVDTPLPMAPETIQSPRLRQTRSMVVPPSHDKQSHSQSSIYNFSYDGEAHAESSRAKDPLVPTVEESEPSSSSLDLLPPTQLQRSPSFPVPVSSMPALPPIIIHLGCGKRKIGRRAGAAEPTENPKKKPETWSENGVGCTNAVVSPLGEGLACQLLYDHSPYLLPDGTLKGRLEARLVKPESPKRCVII